MLIMQNTIGRTPVHEAARTDHLDQIRKMLTQKMLKTQDNKGRKPLQADDATNVDILIPKTNPHKKHSSAPNADIQITQTSTLLKTSLRTD